LGRVAIVSDVHGNLAALEAVLVDLRHAAPDRVVHGGDLALIGPRPAEVVDLVRDLGWPGVLGNTDELLWKPEQQAIQRARAPKLEPLLRILFEEFAPATTALLGPERLSWLQTLPAEWRQDDLTVLHASPGDLWRAPPPDAEERLFLETYGSLGRTAVYGHIHRPFARHLTGLTIANSGSVGMPYDGDWRPSYLVITDGRPEIRRVEYDLAKEIADLDAVDYPRAGWLAEIRRRGISLPPQA
jgi:predicted phosphodiesterase